MKPKIGIIGNGNVGSALKRGCERAGYEARNCGHAKEAVRETARWGDVIILAVPFDQRQNALQEMGDAFHNKPLVDVTNAVSRPDYSLEVEPDKESGAEQLQRMVGGRQAAPVVKAFNTVFADHMDKGAVKGEKLTLFVAGDDEDAKAKVRDLGQDLGFDPIDAGPLKNARWMETLGYFNFQLGQQPDLGREIGFRLVH